MSATPTRWSARLGRWLAHEQRLVGASLLRIGLATVVLYQLLGHWMEREFLWGPHGIHPIALFRRELASTRGPSFFAVDSELQFQAVYVAAVLVAGLYLVGWQTRWLGIWVYAVVWSLVKRNPMLATGGDTLLLVLMPFVLLMNTGAYLSADSRWRTPGNVPPPIARPLAALVHNIALCCGLVQVSLFYGFAGIYKLLGDTWREGTAVYYALRLPEFTPPVLGPGLYLDGTLVRILTYGTLAFELSFPLLMWSRRTRVIVAVQAVAFHAFIGLGMGLAVFAAQALIFQLLLFDDDQYVTLGRRLRGLSRPRLAPGARSPAGHARSPRTPRGDAAAPSPHCVSHR